MLNQNNNYKGHLMMKVSAALAAMALVSGTSIGMYKLCTERGTDAPAYTLTDSAAVNSTDTAESSDSSAAAKASGVSFIELASRENALTVPEIVEKAMPSAVGISSTFTYSEPASASRGFMFGGMRGGAETESQQMEASGSGIVMSSDGYIITNAHVIYDTESSYQMGKATSVKVVMGENHDEEYDAEIVGYDLQTDLAV
ncbi:MAG: trypsin-like peptidase domain-containing protein, partial [Oscillospiraceae bacterium]|nr:trypsin-like peptidase domain-containing protein [Oscillospiraceae bacterium]